MSVEAIVRDLESANQLVAEARARLVAERKKHEAAIKSIDAILAGIPNPKPVKASATPAKAVAVSKGPSLGDEIAGLARDQPGITAAQLAAALEHRPKKSVVNTASRLVSEGKLARQGKGYAAPALAAE